MTDPLAAFPEITPEQSAQFSALVSGEFDNFVLMSVHLEGAPTVAICAVTRDGELVDIHPLYIAVTDAMFDRLTPPPTGAGAVPATVVRPGG